MHTTPVSEYWSLVREVTLWAQGVATHAGTRLTVSCPDGPRDAIVVDAPWFKAEKVIPPGIGDG